MSKLPFKLPLRIEESSGDYYVYDADNLLIMCDRPYYPSAPTREEADAIIEAVNGYHSTEQR